MCLCLSHSLSLSLSLCLSVFLFVYINIYMFDLKGQTSFLPISLLIRSSRRMNRLITGWNEFKRAPSDTFILGFGGRTSGN